MTETNHISVDKIRVDGGTQMRAVINEETVKEYTERYLAGERMPALVVFYDGSTYWLADGFHRHRALVDSATPRALCEIHKGTQRDAVLFGCGANASHGLRRTNADKRRAVEALLRDEEWAQWGDNRIARQCGVSHTFVSSVRESSCNGCKIDADAPRLVERGGKVYEQNTANIGKRSEPHEEAPSPSLLPPAPPAAIPPPPVAPVARPVERILPALNTTREVQEADSAALALCGFMDRATMALGEQSYHVQGHLLSEDRAGRLNVSISQLEAAIAELKANLGAQQ